MSQQPPGNPRGPRPASRPGGDPSSRQQPPGFGQFGQPDPEDPFFGTSRRRFDATQPLPPRPDLAGPPGEGYEPDLPPSRPSAARRPAQPAPGSRDPYGALPDPWDEPAYGDEAWAQDPPPPRRPSRSSRAVPDPLPDPGDPDAWDVDFAEPPRGASARGRDAVVEEAWEEDDLPPPRRSRRERPAGRTPSRPRPAMAMPSVRIPAGVRSNDLAGDSLSLALLGAGVVSILLMAIVLATQAGKLPPQFAQHLDAAGIPDRWGSARVLWRIPLLALGVTAMNGVLAWFLARRDRFASRFVLAAALFVQFIAWIALFDFI